MDSLNRKLIEECLKDHIYSSDEDADSDCSSNCRTVLDDDYYANTEKPIPLDKVKRNLISPSKYQQWEINQNPWRQRNASSASENYTTSSGTVVYHNSNLPDLVNTAGIVGKGQIVDVDVTPKHAKKKIVVDTSKHVEKRQINNAKPVTDTKSNHSSKHDNSIIVGVPIGNNLVAKEFHYDVKKKPTQPTNSQKSQLSSSNQFGNNTNRYLLKKEDVTEVHLKQAKPDVRLEKQVRASKKQKDKNAFDETWKTYSNSPLENSRLNKHVDSSVRTRSYANILTPTKQPNGGSWKQLESDKYYNEIRCYRDATFQHTQIRPTNRYVPSGNVIKAAIPRSSKTKQVEYFYDDLDYYWMHNDPGIYLSPPRDHYRTNKKNQLKKSRRKEFANLQIPHTIVNIKSLSIGDDLYLGVSYIIANCPRKRNRYPLSMFYLIGTVLSIL